MYYIVWCWAPLYTVPLDPAISIIRHRLKQDMQLHLRTSMSIQHIITLIGICLLKHLFPLPRQVYVSRYLGQPLDLPSFQLWLTCSWKCLTSRPSTLGSPGPANTLLTTVYRKPTTTSTYIGTAITICQLSILCSKPSYTGLGLFALPPNCSLRRRKTSERLHPGANTSHGHSLDSELGTASNTATHRLNWDPISITTTVTVTSAWWFPIPRVSGKGQEHLWLK